MNFTHISTCLPSAPESKPDALRLIEECWRDLAGEVAPFTRPVSLKRGTLTVDCAGEEWAEKLMRIRREVIKNVNSLFNSSVVLRLRWLLNRRITSSPVPSEVIKPDPESIEIASVIEDPALREIFIRFLSLHRSKLTRP